MTRLIGFAVFASIVAIAFPSAFEEYRARMQAANVEDLDPPPRVVEAALPGPSASTRLKAGPDGHFHADARFGSVTEPVLVDTGATYVAMSETTARRLGIRLRPSDFTATAETANGRMPVALTKVPRLAVGSVEAHDVEVMVAKGDVLGTTLLGMSFLKQLKSFSVAGDTLTLVR